MEPATDDEDRTIESTIEWLERDRAAAWQSLHHATRESVRRLARRWRLQSADVDDVADVVLLRLVMDDFAALRRAEPSAPLGAWATGVAKNVLRERSRSEHGRATSSLDERDLAAPAEDPDPARASRLVSLELLTPTQRAVVAPLLAGASERRVAAMLGVTRDRVHDVKRRAVARLKSGKPHVPSRTSADRSWALAAAEQARRKRHDTTARVLALFASGASRSRIAAETSISKSAVKARIHRRRPTR